MRLLSIVMGVFGTLTLASTLVPSQARAEPMLTSFDEVLGPTPVSWTPPNSPSMG
ncbi:MAG: hypothetical protein AB8I08_05020 [Sandaracinaceae bacterium]